MDVTNELLHQINDIARILLSSYSPVWLDRLSDVVALIYLLKNLRTLVAP